MAGEEIDVRITMEVRASNTDSENFTVTIEISDTSSPRISYDSLQRFEQIVHDAVVEHILGITESKEIETIVMHPLHKALESRHKICYNRLSGKPKR